MANQEKSATNRGSFRPSVAEMWDAFLRKAVPPGAPAIQITEMRTAFFTGCWSLMNILATTGLDEDSEPTDADLAYMSRLNEELNAFLAEFPVEMPAGRSS